jgi:hypothetical protein
VDPVVQIQVQVVQAHTEQPVAAALALLLLDIKREK